MQKFKIIWYKFKARAMSSVVNLFASQSNYDIQNTILIIGSARSGTTFLMESLNSKNEYRIIFEPFNPTYTKEWNSFSARHYIDPKNVKEDERQAVATILSGKINNNWVDQYNRKIRSKKRLIKSVRANLMLDYLESEYPELLIIYLHRNPYEVVASRINLNFDPNDVFLVLDQDAFLKKSYSDIDLSALRLLLNNPVSCHAALWCFENRYIMRGLENRPMLIAKYEDIIGKTVKIKNGVLEITGEVRRPSVTSTTQKSYQFSQEENNNVVKVLSLFGMTEYIKTS